MRVMLMIKGDPEPGAAPSEELLAAMGRYNDELKAAGVLLDLSALHPSAEGRRVKFSGGKRTVIDGPFAEARELVAGFSIWQVKDMDEALAWVARCPNTLPDRPGVIEIRPFYEAADLAEFLTPEELSTPRDGERGKLGVA